VTAMRHLLGSGLTVAVLALGAGTSRAAVSLPAVLGEHAVVQRELPFHVWGQALPGETVTTRFRGESRTAVADELGRWSVFHSPGAAGGPFTLTVDASNTVRLDDVWVGDVWLAAGQSNMEFTLDNAEGAAAEIPQASEAGIRFLRAVRRTSSFPLTDVATEGWKVCTPEAAPKFSAIAYFFARRLREQQPVPIGVIDASWGGTPLAAFTPLPTIAGDPALLPALVHWSRMADARATTLLELEKEQRELATAAARARAHGQAAPSPQWHPDFEAWAPAAIYNAMVAPLTPFAIRGVIWYHGESDASPERAPVYARLFQAMIRSWRRAWGVGEFPFLFVQLANWTAGPGNAWPELREAQREALTLANTGMAVAIDVGDKTDIHPRDKKTVGTRLALAARALAYGEKLAYSGPLLRQVVPEGPALRVLFDHAEGLTTRGGAPVEGFEIAGADGRYVPAQARIEGSTVVVSTGAVAAPRSVRYGWADNPRVSLYNAAGLPASPFRSAN
jgi:sialate O-acetylesterase